MVEPKIKVCWRRIVLGSVVDALVLVAPWVISVSQVRCADLGVRDPRKLTFKMR